jgi:glutathione synthase/RimK-type ligase-like ATP-grasp enzyme
VTSLLTIALLTDHRYIVTEAPPGNRYVANILKEDELLKNALEKMGIASARVNWADPEVDWSVFDCALFRTTWDYFERFREFTDWLNRVEQQTRLCNDRSLIRWNMDKHYLHNLEEKGIPVVESAFIEKGSETDLRALLEIHGWNEGVIKPCVSGAARHTYRVNRQNADEVGSVIRPLLSDEAFMLQPFLPHITETGEDTLMVIGGEVTHAVRKKAKPGDFRVQDDHGGTVHEYTPLPEQIKLAERAFAACNPLPVYGRADMVRDGSGRWVIMELELIEPEMWMRMHPPAAEAFAGAIKGYMSEFSLE